MIDPAMVYSTFFWGDGGYFHTSYTAANGIAIDSAGNAYLTGWTTSANYFPTVNAMQSSCGGAQDAFISKLSADGSTLIYSTFLGGSAAEEGKDIAVDTAGNAYVTGSTVSDDFPVSTDAFQTDHGGGLQDVFVVKLSLDGSELVYSTYLGAENGEVGEGITLDATGNVYVTGWTTSLDFPTANALQPIYGGHEEGDTFVSKLNPDGSDLVYSTFLGGSGAESGTSIALDMAESAYITGFTTSGNFPTANALQSSLGGAQDAFISKLSPDGFALVYSTYLGGSSADLVQNIALDSGGNAYITGFTISNNFPTVSAYQASSAGAEDVFISKLSADGSTLIYSTYLGGSEDDKGFGIAVDSTRNIYVTGWTRSNPPATTDFPTVGSVAGWYDNVDSNDVFVSKLSASGLVLIYSTILSGFEEDKGFEIAVDVAEDAYVTGWTNSPNFPTMPANVYQPNFVGDMGAFVTKLSCQGSTTYYRDSDHDGYGDRQNSVQSCGNPLLGLYVTALGVCRTTEVF